MTRQRECDTYESFKGFYGRANQCIHWQECKLTLAKEYQHKVETGCYVNRTYGDYQKFLAEHPGVGPVYMDLVIGRPGGTCLMTLPWLNAGFMIGILIPNKCAENVTDVFDRLYDEFKPELFAKLFPMILTDSGTEFSNLTRIEFLYCDGTAAKLHIDRIDPKDVVLKPRLVGIEMK